MTGEIIIQFYLFEIQFDSKFRWNKNFLQCIEVIFLLSKKAFYQYGRISVKNLRRQRYYRKEEWPSYYIGAFIAFQHFIQALVLNVLRGDFPANLTSRYRFYSRIKRYLQIMCREF